MGKSASKAREQARSKSEQDQKHFNDSIGLLYGMAKEKQQTFQSYVFGNQSQKQLPINTKLRHKNSIRVGVSSDQNISGPLNDAIGSFASGNFMKGIQSVITAGITYVLGNYSGQQSQEKGYVIALGDNGAILRIDYLIFSYQFKSQGMVNVAKNVLLVDYIISSAETKDLNKNTVRSLVELCYGNLPVEDKRSLANQIIDQLNEQRATLLDADDTFELGFPRKMVKTLEV